MPSHSPTSDLSCSNPLEGLPTCSGAGLDCAQAQLVRPDRPGTFTFSHDTIRACLYDEVGVARRTRVHTLIGRLLQLQLDHASPVVAHRVERGKRGETEDEPYSAKQPQRSLPVRRNEVGEWRFHYASTFANIDARVSKSPSISLGVLQFPPGDGDRLRLGTQPVDDGRDLALAANPAGGGLPRRPPIGHQHNLFHLIDLPANWRGKWPP